MSQHVISIREIIAIALTMAKRTDSMYRSRPIYEVSSFSHGKRYRNDLLDADECW